MNVISPLLIIIDDNNDDDTINDTNTTSGYKDIMTNMIVPLLSIEQHSDNVNDVDDNVYDDDNDNVDDTQMYNNSNILRYYIKQHMICYKQRRWKS
jgi:hypothetical protein